MDSVEELYTASYRRLVVQLVAFTGDLGDAEDLVQEAFVRAIGRWSQVRDYDNPEAWLRTVALNLARSRWRRGRRHAAALLKIGPPRDGGEVGPDHVAIVTALRSLPAAQREALVLHHFVGLSVEEVAAQCGAPSGTIKARLSRGRAALAPRLET